MKLYLGGAYQGKLDYVLDETDIAETEVLEGGNMRPDEAKNAVLINHYHLLIRTLVEEGQDVEAFTASLIRENPDVVILCDEIGMGVVPVDALERAWREAVGRSLCTIAQASESVTRILCGIGTRIK